MSGSADHWRTTGRVYFIGGKAGPIKIGFTSQSVRARLATLQSASPIDLEVLAAVAGAEDDEVAYHRWFAAYRIRGEWFERAPELLAEIERLRLPGATPGRRPDFKRSVERAYATAAMLKQLGRATPFRSAPVHGEKP